jgi:hypothetical protein
LLSRHLEHSMLISPLIPRASTPDSGAYSPAAARVACARCCCRRRCVRALCECVVCARCALCTRCARRPPTAASGPRRAAPWAGARL